MRFQPISPVLKFLPPVLTLGSLTAPSYPLHTPPQVSTASGSHWYSLSPQLSTHLGKSPLLLAGYQAWWMLTPWDSAQPTFFQPSPLLLKSSVSSVLAAVRTAEE